jgi:tetratricopeptide (TPR) repeat protein
VVYDAFLSFTRKGHPDVARQICKALGQAGLRVFIDEGIDEGDPISDHIVDALAQSMTLIVVYSKPYLGRNACQEELRRVFIAAEAEGDPSRRIVVVNPEEGNDHIAPAELRDARYVAARGPGAELGGLIRAVRERSLSLPGPMSSIKRSTRSRWLPPRIPGTPDFVGRHRDLWKLHTALRAADFPLTHATSSGPAAVVAGMAGIGKTSLARAYAWQFGTAYPGGVYLTSLKGTSDFEGAVEQHGEEVRLLAHSVGLPVVGVDNQRLPVLMGDYIDGQPGPSLWIADDLPPGLAPQILHRLVIPARSIRTIFISRDAGYGAQARAVPLHGLATADAEALLKAARAIEDPGGREAARLIAKRLGGHPMALKLAASNLRNRRHLRSYAEYAATLETDDDVLNLVGQSLSLLEPAERVIVELAGCLESQPLPTQLIEIVLTTVIDTPGQPADIGLALNRLETLGLARRDGPYWHIHPLISEAASHAGPALVSFPTLTFATARGILTFVGSAISGSSRSADNVIRLARTLTDSPVLADTDEADLLYRLTAEHYESLGDVAQVARIRRRLAVSQPGSPRELGAAALACNSCGDHADAHDFAHRALSLERSFLALWALADSLDGLGRYTEADAVWLELDAADLPPSTPQAQLAACNVSRARAHLARGELRKAAICLEDILARHAITGADDTTVHQVNSATVQLARLRIQAGREQEGRALARSVMTFYRDRNAEKHATCLEAELVWAEAAVSVALLELKPDRRSWAEAEKTMQRLHDSYRESAGPDSVLTLTAAVQRALVLVRMGKHNKRSSEILNEVLPRIKAQLGEKHPLSLRSRYILALNHLHQNDFEGARSLLETVWTGQKEVLGPRHPDTLSTQLELGCVLKLSDADRSRQLNSEVRKTLPHEVGRKNFMYGRAFFATTLLPLIPVPAARRLWELTNRIDYDPNDQ